MPFDFPDLLARARAGDEEAFAGIYRSLQPLLLRYLRVTAPGHAEDVAADTWIAVTRGLQEFSGDEAGFRAWVFTIARHRAVDAGRARSRRRDTWFRSDLDVDDPLTEDPADVLEEQESTREAIRLIRTLPVDQAEVLMLRIVGGLANAEVAALLGKTPGAVRVLAHRGLRRLSAELSVDEALESSVAPPTASTDRCNARIPMNASRS